VIGKLKGIVDEIEEDHVVLDVHGVGYRAFCSARTLARLPASGEAAVLYIDTHVREDAIRLYGFLSAGERQWFRLLNSVQGVGAKVALSILGLLSPDELSLAIAREDKAVLARASGVGKRLAERLVVELRTAAGSMPIAANVTMPESYTAPSARDPVAADAMSALMNLGWAEAQARAAVTAARSGAGEEATAATLIRLALKELAR